MEPFAFCAITVTRIRVPRSADVSLYELLVALPTGTQAAPEGRQRSHEYALELADVHVPGAAASTEPTTVVP